MQLLTPSEVKEIDKAATKVYGIPSVLLMEQAAYQVFSYIKAYHENERVMILCGPGNNGGDGLALFRQLKSFSKCQTSLYITCTKEKLTEDGKVYYSIAEKLNGGVMHVTDSNLDYILDEMNKADIIVDALFGTGLSREIQGIYKEIIEGINKSTGKVISVDIPSGIDGLTGKVKGCAVYADTTITFVRPKIGLYGYPAILHTGDIKVANIGIPEPLIHMQNIKNYLIDTEEMKQIVPKRQIRSNKGSFGKLLVIGGSLGMSGAISLASLSAYKVGCGTVTVAVPRSILEIVQCKLTEVMAIGLKDTDGHFSLEASEELEELIWSKSYSVIALGPGMGRDKANLEIIAKVLRSNQPCIIDADALYFLPHLMSELKSRKAPTIITPHPGEMARLTGKTIEEILENPTQHAKEYAEKNHVITILKLEKTVIADPSGNIYINRYGNTGLAKGGSGDLLTGIIAGLLAQHMKALDAAKLGVYLQTRAADLAKKELSEYSFLASDTITFLSKVFIKLLE